MKPLRILARSWWLLLPVVVLAGGYGWHTGTFTREWAHISGGPPVADYPPVVDLGERTPNEIAVHRLEISNRGGQELVIGQIRSSCSCGALEQEVNGGYAPVEELRLPPGGRAELVVRLTVQANGAGSFSQVVSFLTNDPAQPEGRITLLFQTTSGGIRTDPTTVQFGRVPIGKESRQVVDILDRDPSPQTVTRVV